MKTGREFLNEHIEETNIPAEHWEIEIGEMMDWYADYYHQAKLKLLGIGIVSNAERTLNDFFAYLDGLGDKFDSNSLEGHKRDWLKSFNDC